MAGSEKPIELTSLFFIECEYVSLCLDYWVCMHTARTPHISVLYPQRYNYWMYKNCDTSVSYVESIRVFINLLNPTPRVNNFAKLPTKSRLWHWLKCCFRGNGWIDFLKMWYMEFHNKNVKCHIYSLKKLKHQVGWMSWEMIHTWFSFSNFKLSLTIKGNSTFSIVAITFIDHYYKSIEKTVVPLWIL